VRRSGGGSVRNGRELIRLWRYEVVLCRDGLCIVVFSSFFFFFL